MPRPSDIAAIEHLTRQLNGTPITARTPNMAIEITIRYTLRGQGRTDHLGLPNACLAIISIFNHNDGLPPGLWAGNLHLPPMRNP